MKILFNFLLLLMVGCTTVIPTKLYQDEYLELSVKDQIYYFSDQAIEKKDSKKLPSLLRKYGTKKLLLISLDMRDLFELQMILEGKKFEFYYLDNNDEIKQISFD